MTYLSPEPTAEGRAARCEWCHRSFPVQDGAGRPRRYCRRSCRQRSYEARRRAAELGAAEDELIVSRRRTEDLLDRLDVLRRALVDVDRDLSVEGARDDVGAIQEALQWLRQAALDAVGEAASP